MLLAIGSVPVATLGSIVPGRTMDDGRVVRVRVRRHHRVAVVRHPVGVRLPWITRVLNLDRAVDVRRAGAELDDRAFAVERDVHLVGVDARHHVRRRLAELQAPDQRARPAVEDVELLVEPLRLVDQRLRAIRPHVVRVVHVHRRQRDLARHGPVGGVHRGRGTRLRLAPRSARTRCRPRPRRCPCPWAGSRPASDTGSWK